MSDLTSSTRRYVFQIHGRSERYGHWLRRQQVRRERSPQYRQHRQRPYQPQPGQQLAFDGVIDHENLLVVYDRLRKEGGQAPGGDGLGYDDLSRSEIAAALRQVSHAIRNRRYRPHPTRPVRIPKSNGRYRELRLATIVDRTVAKALQEAIIPVLDPIFSDTVFGFRPSGRTGDPRQDRGVWPMLLSIERTAIEQGAWVIAQDDIRDAFPSVPVNDVLADFNRHITDDSVLWLIETVLRGHEGQSRTTGIDQGSAVSPVALLLRLHHALVLPLVAAGQGHPLWHCEYADNFVFACRSVIEGQQALARAREILLSAGFALKSEDGPPNNLKRRGAHVEILGFRLGHREGRLQYGLGRKAWEKLERRLTDTHDLPDPQNAARAVAQGWVASHGPAFEDEANDRQTIQRLWETAGQKVFRELGSEAELQEHLLKARQRWRTARERLLGALFGRH